MRLARFVAIVFPISAFVAAGFEHSVANMYFVPFALLIERADAAAWLAFAVSLVPVTLGNIVGGGVLVAAVYHLIYGRAPRGGS